MKRAALLLGLLLAACTGTSPEPDYYDLAAVDGAPQPGATLSIKIQRPSLPEYLDRPYIVREENAYQYKIDDLRWWMEPLDRMFERILTEDLRQRLPGSTVLSESDTGTVGLQYIVETNIEQFNAVDQNKAALKAVLLIHDKNSAPIFAQQSIELTAPLDGSAESLAAALSILIAGYADRVETLLQQQTPSPSNP